MLTGISSPFSPILLTASLGGIFFIVPRINKKLLTSNLLILFFSFLALYLVIASVSGVFNQHLLHPKNSYYPIVRGYVSSFVIVYIFYLLGVYYSSINKFKYLISVVMILLILSVGFTLFADVIGLTDSYQFNAKKIIGERKGGLFANPNEAGQQANYCLATVLFGILVYKRKIILGLLIAPILYSSFITFSKAALIVSVLLLALFVFFGVSNFLKFKTGNRILVVSFLFVIFSTAIVVPSYFNNNILGNLTVGQKYRIMNTIGLASGKIDARTTSERTVISEIGIKNILKHPIFGSGLGSFHRLKEYGLGVHNSFLMVAGEAGILPFAMFFLFSVLVVLKSFWIQDPTIKIFFLLVLTVMYLQVFMPTHDALSDRTSNAFLGIIMGFLRVKSYNKIRFSN